MDFKTLIWSRSEIIPDPQQCGQGLGLRWNHCGFRFSVLPLPDKKHGRTSSAVDPLEPNFFLIKVANFVLANTLPRPCCCYIMGPFFGLVVRLG